MMRLRLMNPFKIDESEKLFIIVSVYELNNDRELVEIIQKVEKRLPLIVSKCWTFSKLIDILKKNSNLNILNEKNCQQVRFSAFLKQKRANAGHFFFIIKILPKL